MNGVQMTGNHENSRFQEQAIWYTVGHPRQRFYGGTGIGRRSTSLTNVTSRETWDTIGLPSILVVTGYYNDRCNALLGQASSLASCI